MDGRRFRARQCAIVVNRAVRAGRGPEWAKKKKKKKQSRRPSALRLRATLRRFEPPAAIPPFVLIRPSCAAVPTSAWSPACSRRLTQLREWAALFFRAGCPTALPLARWAALGIHPRPHGRDLVRDSATFSAIVRDHPRWSRMCAAPGNDSRSGGVTIHEAAGCWQGLSLRWRPWPVRDRERRSHRGRSGTCCSNALTTLGGRRRFGSSTFLMRGGGSGGCGGGRLAELGHRSSWWTRALTRWRRWSAVPPRPVRLIASAGAPPGGGGGGVFPPRVQGDPR